MAEPTWLTIARELQAIGQIGLAYTKDAFDKERYDRVLTLAASLMACGSGAELELVLDLFRPAAHKDIVEESVCHCNKLDLTRRFRRRAKLGTGRIPG